MDNVCQVNTEHDESCKIIKQESYGKQSDLGWVRMKMYTTLSGY